MKYISIFVLCAFLVLVSSLAVLNWQTLLTATLVNLGNVQLVAPLGLIMLSSAGLLGVIFGWFYMHQRISARRETRDLARELERSRKLATQAETSRINDLQHSIMTEFRLLHERLNTLSPGLTDGPFPPREFPAERTNPDADTRH